MKKLERNILREQFSNRGGGVELDLTEYGYDDERLSAYQNYLGGGLLGRVANDSTVKDWEKDPKLVKLAGDLRKYYKKQAGIGDESDGLAVSAY